MERLDQHLISRYSQSKGVVATEGFPDCFSLDQIPSPISDNRIGKVMVQCYDILCDRNDSPQTDDSAILLWQGKERFHAFVTKGTGAGWNPNWSVLEGAEGVGFFDVPEGEQKLHAGMKVKVPVPIGEGGGRAMIIAEHRGSYDVDENAYFSFSGLSPCVPKTWPLVMFGRFGRFQQQLGEAYADLADIGFLLSTPEIFSLVRKVGEEEHT